MIPSYLHHLWCITTYSTSTSQWLSCPIVNNYGPPALACTLAASDKHQRPYLCDPMAPPGVTLMPIFGRLGTRRLGTGSLSISFVVWPSQGSLECSLWISLG
jgi:hypothetical protein